MVSHALSSQEVQMYKRKSVCTKREIKKLWQRFSEAEKGKGFITSEELQEIHHLACNPFAARIAQLFSPSGDGQLSFLDFLELHDCFHESTPVDTKIAWAFAIWDFDGDDKLDAADMRRGVRLLTNGTLLDALTIQASTPPPQGVPAMFDDQPVILPRRQSAHTDLLSQQEISQVLQRVAAEVEPVGSGISFEDFEGLVIQLPDFFSNYTLLI